MITIRQSVTEDPDYFIHNLKSGKLTQITKFENPYPQLAGVHKGFGATVRLVMLPNKSHGYAARETILHKHWEVLNWMDKYVKNKK